MFNAAQRRHTNFNCIIIQGAELGPSKNNLFWFVCCITSFSLHRFLSRHKAALTQLCKNAFRVSCCLPNSVGLELWLESVVVRINRSRMFKTVKLARVVFKKSLHNKCKPSLSWIVFVLSRKNDCTIKCHQPSILHAAVLL